MRKKEKNRIKRLGVALIMILLAGSFTACGKKETEDDETKKKLEEADQKVAQLEEEDKEEEEFVFREEESGAVLTKYNGTEKEVIIPDEYNGLAVVKIEENSFRGNTDILLIQIPSTVTSISNSAISDESSIVIRSYSDTYAELYAVRKGLTFESMGENTRETDVVIIWDKDGAHCTNLYRGQIVDDESLKGVTFKQVDGKSVLVLDNCDIGSVEVEDFAALTIELTEGSENKIAGARGRSGISTSGKLTIKGSGKLSVFGSDYYSISDGAGSGSWVGEGLYIFGDLSIEEGAQVYVKSGNGKAQSYAVGAYITGNLLASGGMLEIVSGTCENYLVPALLVDSLYEGRDGEILLDGVNITGGGQIVPIVYRGIYEDTGEAYEEQGGVSISGEAEVGWTQEEGYKGASTHIIIGQ